MRKLLVDVERRLIQAGIDSARTDAELLLAHVLGRSRSQLILATEISKEQQHQYELLVRRRVLREPLQYIIGTAAFRKIELKVGPGVLVPRPETELIVDIVKRFGIPGVCLDLGAGSGCIALSIAVEIPGVEVLAVENSSSALNYLRKNLELNSTKFATGSNVTILETDLDMVSSIKTELIGQVQTIVSNPPYVPIGSPVSAEVQYFEPSEAIFAEANGFGVIDSVIEAAKELLAPGGLIVIEHHENHGPSGLEGGVIKRLQQSNLFRDAAVVEDLNQRPRFTYAYKVEGK